MEKKKGKCKKKKKLEKQKLDIDFSDFSFLGPETEEVDYNKFKITQQDLHGSASLKLLYDEFVSPRCLSHNTTNTDKLDMQLLRADDCEVSSFKLKKWNKIEPMYEEVSSLNKQQHSQCLAALEMLSSGREPSTDEEKDNIDAFRRLESKRIAEYEKFSAYVENIWKTKNNVRLLEIQSPLKNYINEFWRYRLSRVFSYPQKYRIASMLPLEINTGNCKQTNIMMIPQDIIYECGSQIPITMPSISKRILNEYEELKSKAPIEGKNESISAASVSRDEIAIDIAQKYDTDVVISASGLKCLLDNHPPFYNREWILPIVIKEFINETDHKKQKIMFIDKPLPSIKYSVQQLNQWVHKISLKTSLISGNEPTQCSSDIDEENGSFVPHSPKSPEIPNSDEEDSELTNEISYDNENKNINSLKIENQNLDDKKKQSSPEQSGKISSIQSEEILLKAASNNNKEFSESSEHKISKDDDSDSDNLLIDENSENRDSSEEQVLGMGRVTRSMSKIRCQISPTKCLRKRHSSTRGESSGSEATPEKKSVDQKPLFNIDNASNINAPPKESEPKNDTFSSYNEGQKTEESTNSKSTVIIQPHTIYRIWKMVEHIDDDGSILKKDKNKELKVLIRSKSHGILPEKDGTQQEIILVPKLEYQLEFGAECPSLSECTRQWCSLTFQPCTKILRVRINPQNSEICSYDFRDLQAITSETFRIHKHNPKRDLNRLFRILNILYSSVLPGTYILKHDVSMSEGAKLYIADNSSDSVQLDLHDIYQNVSLDKMALQQFPWNPIDPFVITTKHKMDGVLPNMFNFAIESKKGKSKVQMRNKTSH